MEFTKLTLSPHGTGIYHYLYASNIEMNILANFLTADLGCGASIYSKPTYQDWAADDGLGMGLSGNITFLEKIGDSIALSDLYSEEEKPVELRLSRQQFITLLDEWKEKVCKREPKEVTIKYEDDRFTIETSS